VAQKLLLLSQSTPNTDPERGTTDRNSTAMFNLAIHGRARWRARPAASS
jgi:hypothetical protein